MNKILYLPTRYFPAISGAELYLQRMAEILNSKFDYTIDICTSNGIDFKSLRNPEGRIIKKDEKYFSCVNNVKVNRVFINYQESIEEKIKKVKDLPAYKALNLTNDSLKAFLNNGPYLNDLNAFLVKSESLEYDLIHTTFFPYFNLIIGLILGIIIKKPTICTPFFHFSNPRYLNPNLLLILKKFNLLIACTNLEKKILIELLGIPNDKVVVIPMGVDYNKFKTNSKNINKIYDFKRKFFKRNEESYKLVLFCGYKNYEKGAISILKSIPYIIDKYRKVYFTFIGPSTLAFNRELTKLRNFKQARIINFTPDNLTGYLDKKKLGAFKQADLYLMPSRSDAFGIAFLEAWAAGKPVIGANVGATPEVIRNNIDGLLVEFDNPFDIAEKVIKLLKNKKLRTSLGLAGKEKVCRQYTWNIIAKRTHNLYQKLLSTSS